HLVAQVLGDGGIGIGQRLVLALHAAQFFRQRVEALGFGAAGELRRGDGGRGLRERGGRQRPRQREQHQRQQGAHAAHQPSTSSSSGSSSSRLVSSLTGPTGFQRITPAASTRKVSGAP